MKPFAHDFGQSRIASQQGVSLVELMVSITLGLLLLAGLATMYVNSSQSNQELQKAGQQIENGRFAMATLAEDVRLAGFFGEFSILPESTAVVDPCNVLSLASIEAGMALPIHTFRAPDLATRADLTAAPACAAILDNLNLVPGTDIIVVRRTHTQPLAVGDTAELNRAYVQTTPEAMEMQVGTGAAITAASKADGVTPATLQKISGSAANIWRYRTHVYFVAPCSIGSGAGGVCAGGDPQVPTLKRLELDLDGGGLLAMNMVPLVEGIELIKAEVGIDNLPTAVNPQTFMPGDSIVDAYSATPAIADFDDAISIKLFVLARNVDGSPGYNDTKTYLLGSAAPVVRAAANDRFKRHVFAGETVLANLAGRKEIPQ